MISPERLLPLSFAGLIAFGTIGLKTVPGLYVDQPLGWLDAFFTATSAVCVTGLIVVDTATYFTHLGQAFLLLLIQLGGLGFLTLTTLVIVGLGRRLSLHLEAATASALDVSPVVDRKRLVRHVVVFTLLFEAAGALALFLSWRPRLGVGEAAWHAMFHAVSAFCNAGFSTFTDSLVGFRQSPMTLATTMVLIVLGGLGFLTLEELYARVRRRGRARFRLSLHSRLVLITTTVLLVGGGVAFTVLEWSVTLSSMGSVDKAMNALFMSVTARTAGFNTIDYARTSGGASFLTMLLMTVGGSPGSTAGGMKTTTVAVIGLLALARLRGRRVTSAAYRSIPEDTVQSAVGVFVVAIMLVVSAILMYAVIQLPTAGSADTPLLVYMFEAVSAINTVGLSMGATSELTPAGKALTILLMYVGRVGPLAFTAALVVQRPVASREFRYAYEEVIVG